MVAGGGFYSYYILEGNKLDKEKEIFKNVGAIPRGCNSTSTYRFFTWKFVYNSLKNEIIFFELNIIYLCESKKKILF